MKTTRINDIVKLNTMLLKKSMFFYNDFEECVVRTQPNKEGDVDYWIKYKGHLEFLGTPQNNKIIFETIHLYNLSITKKDYDEY